VTNARTAAATKYQFIAHLPFEVFEFATPNV
jgi:hypothetical protein